MSVAKRDAQSTKRERLRASVYEVPEMPDEEQIDVCIYSTDGFPNQVDSVGIPKTAGRPCTPQERTEALRLAGWNVVDRWFVDGDTHSAVVVERKVAVTTTKEESHE